MLLIPAIDLKDGHCVRLKQGDMDDVTVFSEDDEAHGVWKKIAGLPDGELCHECKAPRTFSAIRNETRSFDSALTPEICGVSSRLGQSCRPAHRCCPELRQGAH